MTLPKLKLLGALALTASLAGGGFGLVALGADEKKPQPAPGDVKKPAADPVKKPVPDGEKPKPAAPDGEKPAKPGVKKRLMTGQVGAVDAATRTVTLLRMGEGGLREDTVKLADDAKITVDGKEVKIDAVPKGATAELNMLNFAKDGQPAAASELSVDASKVVWVVKSADASGVTLLGGGATSKLADRVIKLAPGAKVFVDKKDAKPTDLQAGDVATITLNADGAATAIFVTTRGGGDAEKPAVKPAKFGGKVASVDAAARTISLAPKGEGGKEMVLKLTADAKVTIDGKEAKIGDVAKGATATFTLFSAKDGQVREVSEVTVAGLTFAGAVKQIDTASVTIGNEKFDRVLKLAAGGKVVSGEKEVKLADLKVGDRVTVTLTSDESAAVLIVVGAAKKADGDKPKGDKPKPEKGEGEEDVE